MDSGSHEVWMGILALDVDITGRVRLMTDWRWADWFVWVTVTGSDRRDTVLQPGCLWNLDGSSVVRGLRSCMQSEKYPVQAHDPEAFRS
jgi:hypothetical protein